MPLILIWLWVRPFFPKQLDLGPFFQKWSLPLQLWCDAQITESPYSPLTSAMVCGIDPPPALQEVFIISGLYHLLVVSGSHLALLTAGLKPLENRPLGNFWIFTLLVFYSLLCGGQPPVVRALAQWMIHFTRRVNHPFLSTWAAGILTLSFFPQWIHSLSFWLSWLAALTCQIVGSLRLSSFFSAISIHLLLFPALLGLGSAHPIGALTNWILAPALGTIILPLCLLTAVCGWLTPLTDRAWWLLISILEPLTSIVSRERADFSLGFLAAYIFAIQIIFWQGGIWWHRRF